MEKGEIKDFPLFTWLCCLPTLNEWTELINHNDIPRILPLTNFSCVMIWLFIFMSVYFWIYMTDRVNLRTYFFSWRRNIFMYVYIYIYENHEVRWIVYGIFSNITKRVLYSIFFGWPCIRKLWRYILWTFHVSMKLQKYNS